MAVSSDSAPSWELPHAVGVTLKKDTYPHTHTHTKREKINQGILLYYRVTEKNTIISMNAKNDKNYSPLNDKTSENSG